MNWHFATVPTIRLRPLLKTIRKAGGAVMCCAPVDGGVRVTWTMLDGS